MKQQIGSMTPETQEVTDLDCLFVAIYNLLYERIQTEPNKGIVVCKGKPNQRKVKWSDLMLTAHMLEDFFTFRKERHGDHVCETCYYWKSISQASPHMGMCKAQNVRDMHKWHTCKHWRERE